MPIRNICIKISCFVAGLAILAMPSLTNAQIVFDFPNNGDFDGGAGVGAQATVGGFTMTIVDVFAPEFMPGTTTPTGNTLFASAGDGVGLQVQSDDLGVDNPSVDDIDFFPFEATPGDASTLRGVGNENRDINDGEGFVFEFDQDVVFRQIDFVSLDAGVGTVTITVEGVPGQFDFVDDAVSGDTFADPVGSGIVPAGTNITITYSAASTTTPPATTDSSASTRIDDISVQDASTPDLITFLFDNGTDFDGNAVAGNGVIGVTTSASSANGDIATIELLEIFAPEFAPGTLNPTGNTLFASAGAGLTTQIQGGDLGIDNPSVDDTVFTTGDFRNFNDGEGLTFQFDIPVIFTELDLGSFSGLDDMMMETEPGSMVTVTIQGVATPFTFVPDLVNNGGGVLPFPFGTDFIPAGSDITIEFSSATALATLRLNDFTVSTTAVSLPGDFNQDGMVDCADLDGYVGNIGAAAIGNLAALDIDGDGTLSAADANTHITTLVVTSNGVTGTFAGDLNCDGSVNVLGDAFILIANLNATVTMYSLGDINFDGSVSVLGDAFTFIANLNMTNN